jgi:magnesium transporter
MVTSVITSKTTKWINIVSPTQEDLNSLAKAYPSFHQIDLQSCMAKRNLPTVNLYEKEKYTFFVIHIPILDQNSKSFVPIELDILITKGTLITCYREEINCLVSILEKVREDRQFRKNIMGDGAGNLLYHLFLNFGEYCSDITQKIYSDLQDFEANFTKYNLSFILKEILILRRRIISLQHMIGPQREVIERFFKNNFKYLHGEQDPYWRAIRGKFGQMHTRLNEARDIVDSLASIIDTLASHKINEGVKVLTIATLVTLPVILLATIFGMNIKLPFSDTLWSFGIVLALSIILTLLVYNYLWKKKII